MNQINTLNDLLNAAATALSNRDGDAFEALKVRVQDWLQTDEETEAQLKMLEAMEDAAFELED